MKKFFVALTILLCLSGNVNAAQFTDEQLSEIFSDTAKNAAAPLKLNVVAFKKNFNEFMSDFIKNMNAGDDADNLRDILLIGETNFVNVGKQKIFVQKFLDRIAIVGSVDAVGNFTALNLFAVQAENRNDMLVSVLILNAFVKGISPDLDAQALLTEAKENPVVVKGDVKFSFATVDNLNKVSAAAN